jgi:hypothetical protein
MKPTFHMERLYRGVPSTPEFFAWVLAIANQSPNM